MTAPLIKASDALMMRRAAVRIAGEVAPRHGIGKTTAPSELWTLAHALMGNPHIFGPDFPQTIWHRDSPDFHIETPGGTIGLEVVEAISPQRAHASSEINRLYASNGDDASGDDHDLPKCYDLSFYRSDSQMSKRHEIRRRVIDRKLDRCGWHRDEPQREWAHCMAHAINSKSDRAAKGNYASFQRNELLVYENSGAPDVVTDDALKILAADTDTIRRLWQHFTALHVLTRGRVLTFSAT
ncbi:hypothetical protein [Paracoccus shanxieyensis]|uniref:Uncharacterized protein n=1 Tax=Paracoccus shanxieyensis TaxID=2675752 RepID=A0A6L6IX47_9RHOB|nr:hypothetical protein [Paracoccus shanxieyensis]MTH64449.1 hypothetical protein [Paracoccus shanxieyensis]MTH87558.1 hypothetical protein [Paracoccus shanxieyensis]